MATQQQAIEAAAIVLRPRVLISTEGEHDPPHHHMVVDGHGILIDLSPLGGLGADPSITRITWGPMVMPDGTVRDGGQVFRRGGVRQTTDTQRFFDLEQLRPFIEAHAARRKALREEQDAFVSQTERAAAETRPPESDEAVTSLENFR